MVFFRSPNYCTKQESQIEFFPLAQLCTLNLIVLQTSFISFLFPFPPSMIWSSFGIVAGNLTMDSGYLLSGKFYFYECDISKKKDVMFLRCSKNEKNDMFYKNQFSTYSGNRDIKIRKSTKSLISSSSPPNENLNREQENYWKSGAPIPALEGQFFFYKTQN